MKTDRIQINDHGVTVLGFPLGLTPTIHDLELAFEGEALRTYKTANERRRKVICDAKGLSWLTDLAFGTVLSFDICLDWEHHRKISEVEPSKCFDGKAQIGPYTVQGPFSFDTGEIVRKVRIRDLEVRLVPDERKVRAILIAFQENVRRLKTDAI